VVLIKNSVVLIHPLFYSTTFILFTSLSINRKLSSYDPSLYSITQPWSLTWNYSSDGTQRKQHKNCHCQLLW